ncbi:hypothetical protein GQ55_5G161800 [Panicum hallii var. hallii]|uniref:Uncharacterized protein n=1 Tax=Panicum hallii var. hallii TaxID=1504633 RepID=A0A2T7DGX1_9POAL|nr:hypothetical protein GQ55_5G161800 [Panicum hallii var. hallii]
MVREREAGCGGRQLAMADTPDAGLPPEMTARSNAPQDFFRAWLPYLHSLKLLSC